VHGWGALSGGYDSNAAQSGVGEAVGASPTASTDSGFLSAMASVHGSHHFAERHAGRLFYLGDWLGLLEPGVRDYSLQGHAVGLRLHSAVGDQWLLRVGVGGRLTLSGLEAVEVMTWEGFGDLRLGWDPRGPAATRLDARVAGIQGAEGWDHLSGLEVQGQLGQRFVWDAVEVEFSAGGRHFGIGTSTVVLEEDDLPGCSVGGGAGAGQGADRSCAGQSYVIPLGWSGPSVAANVMSYPLPLVGLGAGGGFEYRIYHDSSFINGVPSSRKQRRDARWRATVSGEVELDQASRFTALLDYRLLASFSNVAYDASDADHYLDYDDRTYVQHIVEAGLLVTF
jgi:hypothetical protein